MGIKHKLLTAYYL